MLQRLSNHACGSPMTAARFKTVSLKGKGTMNRQVFIRLFLMIATIFSTVDPMSACEDQVAGRDGDFVAYTNGVVVDTKSGLEWIAGPDEDTSYYQAVQWVRGLTVAGGRWRMPKARELRTLYKTPGSLSSITPLLKTGGIHVWLFQDDEDLSLYLFRYMDPYGTRGFAVRSASDDASHGEK